jgi:hypothetical protein
MNKKREHLKDKVSGMETNNKICRGFHKGKIDPEKVYQFMVHMTNTKTGGPLQHSS